MMKCFDDQHHVWYPTHEWIRGLCSRCGRKQPGVSDEARREMRDEHDAARLPWTEREIEEGRR